MPSRSGHLVLLISVFVIATCGLIYELIAGTLASYLLGDSVTQFSTVIGVYLFAMGIGSWLSRYVQKNLIGVFIQTELIIGLVGGCSAALLFIAFPWISSFRILLYALVLLIGTLVGLEIPLLLRILKGRVEFKDLVSQVFTFDYIGALLASLLFPLVLVPQLGLVRSAFLFGFLNAAVALAALKVLRDEVPRAAWLRNATFIVLAVLATGLIAGDRLTAIAEREAYAEPIIYSKSTQYQRIVLTRSGSELRLYLNGNLQFSTRDEYRYHEALVHPALARLPAARRVLVLGGGDGLAIREILRYPQIEKIVLVELDPAMTELFSKQHLLAGVNDNALLSPKVEIFNADAFTWLDQCTEHFDLVVADFPDPSNFSLGKLYTTTFFHRVRKVLGPEGTFVVQCTSPWVARKSFWCIERTLQAAGLQTEPYHTYVPSFGEWGFIIANRAPLDVKPQFPAGLRYVSEASFATLFQFPPDMQRLDVEVNRLNNQALVRYFEAEWGQYMHGG